MATAGAKLGAAHSFPGFLPASFEFFRELGENNNKPWFDANRERYEQSVVQPFHSLLDALRPTLERLNPHFEMSGKTNANFSRINRDIRFSKDKTPYKSNFYLWVYDGRRERGHDAQLYAGLNADCLTVGFRIYAAWGKGEKRALETVFRNRLASDWKVFDALVDRVVRRGRYETYWHREEKGEWTERQGLPRRQEDWLTLHAWIVRKVFLPGPRAAVASLSFAATVGRIFTELYPLCAFTSIPGSNWQRGLKK